MPLQTIATQRLYRQIADQVRTSISAGEFPVGTRLPAERELAQQLDVSRPSVREAMIALEVEGWVEVRTGSGVYVLDRSQRSTPAVEVTDWGPLELIRARRVVEGETAAIAADQHQPRHLEAMSRAIDAMAEMADRKVMPLAGDRAFHVAIAEAGGNTVLTETVQGFWDSRRGPLFTRLGGYFETVASWRAAIREHRAVCDAIEARDADAARAAMHAHMDKAHQRFSASWRRAKAA